MSYPILYKANETDFSHLGLGVLSDSISALVTEERNGQFELVIKYPIDGALFKEIKNDRLIKADASNKLKDQRFKIIRITKPAKGFVAVYAEHISYLTQDLALEPEVEYSGDALTALNIWKNNIVDDHPFTVYSDIATTGSGKWTINQVENPRRALGGVQGSILDSYGGEYRFDNYHIGLYSQRGDDSGVLIAYGKNLTDLEQDEEIANTYTSIYPYSVITDEDDSEKEEIITLPERYIDSQYIDNYARRKILTVDFSSGEIKTVEQLRSRTERYIVENDVGVPRVNLRVKFIDLAKTLDYKHLKPVEEINLCDLVTIYFEKLNIMQKAKVIKTVWDVLLDRYESIELGEARASLSDSVNTIVDGKVDKVEERVNLVQVAANGKNKVLRGPQEPITGMSANDLWYKPVGDGEIEMYQWDGIVWRLIVSTAVNEEIDTRISDAKSTADNARTEASKAYNEVQTAITNAQSAYEYAGSAIRAANGKNTVYRGNIRPIGTSEKPLKENDIWFEQAIENGTAVVRLHVHDGNNWVLKANDASTLGGTLDLSGLNVINLNMDSATGGALHLDRGITVENNGKKVLQVENGNVTMEVDNLLIESKGINDVIGTAIYQDNKNVGLVYTDKSGNEKALINIGENGPYLSGENIVLDGNTIVDGAFTVTDALFADNMNISKFTTGTLNAANVNLINVNVENLVGNMSEFVKTHWNAINSRASINGTELKFTHNDGSYTQIGVDGLRRRATGSNKPYHYLVHVTTFIQGESSTTPRWIQLPSEFKGKPFSVYLALADSMLPQAPSQGRYAIHRMVACRHPNFNIDYSGARVPIIAYNKSLRVDDPGITNTGYVQGMLIAIY